VRPTQDELAQLLDIFDQSDWDEMDLRLGDFRLRLSSRAEPIDVPADGGGAFRTPPPAAFASLGSPVPVVTPSVATPPPGSAIHAGALTIRAPSLGRFWRKPNPSEPPFVEVGARVAVGDVVCIVEVMKLFTQVKSDVAGRVTSCPVVDGAMIEFDDVLFVIEPEKG
jgi:acetyl-CoA carboxylase biotin carboxyl carrier protein